MRFLGKNSPKKLHKPNIWAMRIFPRTKSRIRQGSSNSFERGKNSFSLVILVFFWANQNMLFREKRKEFQFLSKKSKTIWLSHCNDSIWWYTILLFTILFLADKKKKNIIVLLTTLPLYVCFLYFWWSHKTNSLYYPLFFLFLRICYYYIVWSYNQLYVVNLNCQLFLAKYCQFLAKYCQLWQNTAM